MSFNRTWILVALFTLVNISIFSVVSKKLEIYLADRMIDQANYQNYK